MGLVLAVVLTACATSPPPRSAAERVADQSLSARVTEALDRQPYLFTRHVDVNVVGGVAYLRGMVWSPEDFRDVRRVALSVPGVTDVVADLDLVRSGRK